jgi:succinate semialdehyde reductase
MCHGLVIMFQIKQPSSIIIGNNSCKNFKFKNNCLVITSPGSKNRGWLNHLEISNYHLFDKVEPNPSIETVTKIITEFSKIEITDVVGIGGGSSLDVAKFVAQKLHKKKIMIPTTFGSGSEVTRISVLKIDGEKKSFHDDNLFADISIIDSFFIYNSPIEIIKNSAIDALAQCSEGFDSKNGNYFTKFLCNYAFELLEEGVMNMDQEKIVKGSLASGLGFGNCSTTLGHALSYVFSNEGYSHGHALSHTTLLAHEFNKSEYYERFKKIVEKLDFSKIQLKQNYDEASELILSDRKHLDNNPLEITKNDIILLLKKIND